MWGHSTQLHEQITHSNAPVCQAFPWEVMWKLAGWCQACLKAHFLPLVTVLSPLHVVYFGLLPMWLSKHQLNSAGPSTEMCNVKMAKFPQRTGASWSHEISGDNRTVSFSDTYPWGTNELYPEVFFFFCFIILTYWKKKIKDEGRHFYSAQREAWSQIKWNALCHFSAWDFLVSVNNHQSAGTSHSYKHTPLSTST